MVLNTTLCIVEEVRRIISKSPLRAVGVGLSELGSECSADLPFRQLLPWRHLFHHFKDDVQHVITIVKTKNDKYDSMVSDKLRRYLRYLMPRCRQITD
jgi:hypothetical protein